RIIHLPVIDTQRPVIIVAGYPNVGKSAFVKAVSSAEPEVASYPFTTKEIVVGHFKKNRQAYQVMDTPGLLDRPLEKRNNIEKKAIAALKNLPGIIVFLVDLSEDCGYSVNHQLSLLDEVRNEFGRERVLPVISKSDLVDNSLHHNKLSKNNEIHAWPQVSINNSESVDKLVGMIVSKLASE
ncbi:MAG: GTPase, partial [Thermoplasmata archaeon]